jgi:catechol 2,3-dioxygenase-like lactoylglutathione lyase family enzyme
LLTLGLAAPLATTGLTSVMCSAGWTVHRPTGNAPKNVEFYSDVLGLRLVKKTVNFDAPEAYHLYFGDEQGSPGSIVTWFEFAGVPNGVRGLG